MKAALRMIVRFTDHADDFGPADFAELRELGVSERGIEQLLSVAALFNIIPRIADALEFDVPDWDSFKLGAKLMLARGYG